MGGPMCRNVALKHSGGFWFTDFGKKFADRMMLGAVYYARADGTLIRRAAFPFLTPNGVGLSPDGGWSSTKYLSDFALTSVWTPRE
jgi:gluconolactonase